MTVQLRWSRGWAIALILGVALAIGGTAALAGHLGATSYTGCLALKGGTLTLIKEGDAPQKPCGPGSIAAHFGSGDITGVLSGTGLAGGGSDGSVTLSLAPTYQLPQTCSEGQVAKWTGTGWTCASDSDSQFSAGIGLQLSGSEFSIDPAYRVPNNQVCAGGEFSVGFDSTGAQVCLRPASVQVFANQILPEFPVSIPEVGSVQIIAINVPAGTYSITVAGNLRASLDEDATLHFALREGPNVLPGVAAHTHAGVIGAARVAMLARRTFGAATQLSVVCNGSGVDVRAQSFGIQALQLN